MAPLAEASEFLAEEDSILRDAGLRSGSSGALFWAFVEELSTTTPASVYDCSAGEEELSQLVVDLALDAAEGAASRSATLLEPLQMRLLELSLATRAYSPTVEAYRQMTQASAAACFGESFAKTEAAPAWAVLPGGGVACSPEDLAAALKKGFAASGGGGGSGEMAEDFFPFDHVFPGASGTAETAETVVLYGAIGSPSFYAFHNLLAEAAGGGGGGGGPPVRYVLRHALPLWEDARTKPDTPLQGFGVFLDIKNMEYRAYDDTAGAGAAAGAQSGDGGEAAAAFPEGEDVSGVVFSTLLERRPELAKELTVLRETLLQEEASAEGGSGGDATELKVWNMKDLGLQAAQAVASAEDPLAALADAAQNFPARASRLSGLKVSDDVRAEVAAVARALSPAGGFGMMAVASLGQPLASTLYVNGIPTVLDQSKDAASLNVFDLLRSLRRERAVAAAAAAAVAPLPPPAAAPDALRRLLANTGAALAGSGEGPGGESGPPRIDVLGHRAARRGGVIWINDLEKDEQYERWPKTMQQLLMPSWQPVRVRKNIYNLVVALDPAAAGERSRTVAATFEILSLIVDQQIPARVGIILSCAEDRRAAASGGDAAWAEAGPAPGTRQVEDTALPRDFAELAACVASAVDGRTALRFLQGLSAAQAGVKHGEDAYDDSASSSGSRTSLGDLVDAYVATLEGLEGGDDARAEAWAALGGLPGGVGDGSGGNGEGSAEGAEGEEEEGGAFAAARVQAALAAESGLPGECWLLNGRLETELEAMPQQIMQVILQEQFQLGALVRSGTLTDRTRAVYSKIVSSGQFVFYPSYHPLINEELNEWKIHKFAPPSEAAKGVTSATTQPWEDGLSWFRSPSAGGSSSPAVVSMVVVATPSPAGLRLAADALSLVVASGGGGDGADGEDDRSAAVAPAWMRVAVAFNSAAPAADPADNDPDVLLAARCLALLRNVAGGTGGGSGGGAEGAALFALEALRAAAAACATGGPPPDGAALVELAEWANLDAGVAAAAAAAWDAAGEASAAAALLQEQMAGVASGLSLAPGEQLAVANGRRVAVTASRGLGASELKLLAGVMQPLGGAVAEEFAEWSAATAGSIAGASEAGEAEGGDSDRIMRVAAFTADYHKRSRVDIEGQLEDVAEELSRGGGGGGGLASLRTVLTLEPLLGAGTFGGENAPENGGFGGFGGFEAAGPLVNVVAVVNPLSAGGQRAAALLSVLRDRLGLPVTLALAPVLEMTELPIKNFYRLALSGAAGAGDSDPTAAVAAQFTRLPRQHVLTMRVETPEAWNVQSAAAVQDADNLRCDAASCGDNSDSDVTYLRYTLKDLLVSGSCYEKLGEGSRMIRPPQGLQLTLRRPDMPAWQHYSDTLVMAILGYFQLKANPGVWELALAPGRGSDLYAIAAGSASAEEEVVAVMVSVRNFNSGIERLFVRKRPGMEDVPLLEDVKDKPGSASAGATAVAGGSDESGGQPVRSRWASFKSKVFGGGDAGSGVVNSGEGAGAGGEGEAPPERIHVFSLATGHLYERFLKIMMLTVEKRASLPVKFWLLENYLSPAFKASASAMAEEYGFEVGYVTYKWPSWLRQQTEKQRIIWGYKILFLDVLFPLEVDKVIYVDADQIVRADLAELWRLDLQGRPYGYTPFCTSRAETLGYQFWRGGFWKNHLGGRPYHISALYVVDLRRFRRTAAADELRALYDNLSRDPNSLANLDQDLPNYAQHSVPIFSLPQEWLWCESWCSDESKATAKTIDLCNNPMHKEPKLAMAKRVIDGPPLFDESWLQLDEEVKAVERRAMTDNASVTASAVSEADGSAAAAAAAPPAAGAGIEGVAAVSAGDDGSSRSEL